MRHLLLIVVWVVEQVQVVLLVKTILLVCAVFYGFVYLLTHSAILLDFELFAWSCSWDVSF